MRRNVGIPLFKNSLNFLYNELVIYKRFCKLFGGFFKREYLANTFEWGKVFICVWKLFNSSFEWVVRRFASLSGSWDMDVYFWRLKISNKTFIKISMRHFVCLQFGRFFNFNLFISELNTILQNPVQNVSGQTLEIIK